MTFIACHHCNELPCRCKPAESWLTRFILALLSVSLGETTEQRANRMERQNFIEAHKHELGETYAAEFWDKYH